MWSKNLDVRVSLSINTCFGVAILLAYVCKSLSLHMFAGLSARMPVCKVCIIEFVLSYLAVCRSVCLRVVEGLCA